MRNFYILLFSFIIFLFSVNKINSQEIKNIQNIPNKDINNIGQVSKQVNNLSQNNLTYDNMLHNQNIKPIISTGVLDRLPKIQPSIIQLSPLQFGSFVATNGGGAIHISYSGERYSTGNVILLYDDRNFSPAIFEVIAPSNTLVQIIFDKKCVLKNQDGNEIILYLNDLNTGNLFVTPENAENGFLVYLGGYINVLSSAEALTGEYVGTINLTIVVK